MPTVNLELVVESNSVQLTTIGEIYPLTQNEDESAVLNNVIARTARSARFVLDPGKYAYRFHVEHGAGKFAVNIGPASALDPAKAKEFDTKVGFEGRVYRFEVAK